MPARQPVQSSPPAPPPQSQTMHMAIFQHTTTEQPFSLARIECLIVHAEPTTSPTRDFRNHCDHHNKPANQPNTTQNNTNKSSPSSAHNPANTHSAFYSLFTLALYLFDAFHLRFLILLYAITNFWLSPTCRSRAPFPKQQPLPSAATGCHPGWLYTCWCIVRRPR